MIFIASPYLHDAPEVMEHRYLTVEQYVAECIIQGECVISPVVNYHHMSERFNMRKDYKFWKEVNHDLLERSDSIRVLMLPDWRQSKGVLDELALSNYINMPVEFIEYELCPYNHQI